MPPLTAEEWAADPRQLLMRPPTVLTLPLAGFGCEAAGWARHGWPEPEPEGAARSVGEAAAEELPHLMMVAGGGGVLVAPAAASR